MIGLYFLPILAILSNILKLISLSLHFPQKYQQIQAVISWLDLWGCFAMLSQSSGKQGTIFAVLCREAKVEINWKIPKRFSKNYLSTLLLYDVFYANAKSSSVCRPIPLFGSRQSSSAVSWNDILANLIFDPFPLSTLCEAPFSILLFCMGLLWHHWY